MTSEATFCQSCWSLLRPETRRRIRSAHNTRNRRCIDRYVSRGKRELSKLQKEVTR